MSGFLLDTNVISDLRKPRPNAGLVAWISEADEFTLFLSVLTVGELRIGITMQQDARKRRALETWLVSDLMPRFGGRLLPFDLGAAERWGQIEGNASSASGKLPVIDGLLAATALHHGLSIVTNNETDFSRSGVQVLNPWR